MLNLLVATSNRGKLREIGENLDPTKVKIVSLADLGIVADCEENGDTFEDNALLKARYYAGKSGMLTLAEDSGVIVDALVGELGVKTRRWGAGEQASDQEWIEFFLKRMANIPLADRGAKFICVAALVDLKKQFFPDDVVVRGETRGVITDNLEAPIYNGLPLSSCFRPDGFDKVYSALEIFEKNRISHRGMALRPIVMRLAEVMS